MNDKTNQRDPTRDLQLGPQSRLRAFVLLALTIAGLYLCLWLLLPFLPALVWALALAILFVPAHRRVETELKNTNLAAASSVFLIGLVVVMPVILISGRVVHAAAEGAVTVKDKLVSAEWRQALESNELLAPLARWVGRLDLQPTFETVTTWLTATSASFVTGSVLGLLSLLVTFYFGGEGPPKGRALNVPEQGPLPKADIHRPAQSTTSGPRVFGPPATQWRSRDASLALNAR